MNNRKTVREYLQSLTVFYIRIVVPHNFRVFLFLSCKRGHAIILLYLVLIHNDKSLIISIIHQVIERLPMEANLVI